ncbi:MAG: hypothetical protein EP340_09200 [Alphaproteobacteria bacterium]|nr:MAG: hypothetical protein EP340_09200 [Alphaproteobacteria bacterium]
MYKPLTAGKFGLIIILFFLPFVTFSCTDQQVLQVTGIQMVTGDEITITNPLTGEEESGKLEREDFALFAFGLAIAGLIGALVLPGALVRLTGLTAGGGGFFFLYRLKDKIEADVMNDNAGLITVLFEDAYWGAFALFGLTALVALISLVVRSERGSS